MLRHPQTVFLPSGTYRVRALRSAPLRACVRIVGRCDESLGASPHVGCGAAQLTEMRQRELAATLHAKQSEAKLSELNSALLSEGQKAFYLERELRDLTAGGMRSSASSRPTSARSSPPRVDAEPTAEMRP